jgi:tRNA G10  N-methylase Trm11
MQQYFFQLGNTPELSLAELQVVLPGTIFSQVHPDLASAKLDDNVDVASLMEKLGGTVKIIKVLANKEGTAKENLEAVLAQVLADTHPQEGKIHFALAELGRDHLPMLDPTDVKRALVEMGYGARFVEGSRHGLSASVLLHSQRVRELYVIQTSEKIFLGETAAVQNIDEWSRRDRSKPYADRKKGMLPPKVARMMVNMGLGMLQREQQTQIPLLLDPFCGSGTIAMEALLSDCDVIAGDLDSDAVHGTRQNLDWLNTVQPFDGTYAVVHQDATLIKIPKDRKVNLLVTEPFLGKPRPNPAKLPFIFKGLEKLYLGAFKHWTKILNPGAAVVIVFPVVETNNNGKQIRYDLRKLIDKISHLGYTTHSEPILYHRPQAVVQREIHAFIFQPGK